MLLHIIRVDYCEAYHLRRATYIEQTHSIAIADPLPWTRLCTAGLSALETTENVEKGVRTPSAKLTATLPEPLAQPTRPLAFLLTCADGRQYVLGKPCAPYPLTVQETTMPESSAEKSATSLVASAALYIYKVI